MPFGCASARTHASTVSTGAVKKNVGLNDEETDCLAVNSYAMRLREICDGTNHCPLFLVMRISNDRPRLPLLSLFIQRAWHNLAPKNVPFVSTCYLWMT